MPNISETVTVTNLGNSLRVVIPRTLTKPLDIRKGETLLMETMKLFAKKEG